EPVGGADRLAAAGPVLGGEQRVGVAGVRLGRRVPVGQLSARVPGQHLVVRGACDDRVGHLVEPFRLAAQPLGGHGGVGEQPGTVQRGGSGVGERGEVPDVVGGVPGGAPGHQYAEHAAGTAGQRQDRDIVHDGG